MIVVFTFFLRERSCISLLHVKNPADAIHGAHQIAFAFEIAFETTIRAGAPGRRPNLSWAKHIKHPSTGPQPYSVSVRPPQPARAAACPITPWPSKFSSLAPFSPPSGTFRHHPAGRPGAAASGSVVACSPPPPDVVVTRERGKNAELIAALVSTLQGPYLRCAFVLESVARVHWRWQEEWLGRWCCSLLTRDQILVY